MTRTTYANEHIIKKFFDSFNKVKSVDELFYFIGFNRLNTQFDYKFPVFLRNSIFGIDATLVIDSRGAGFDFLINLSVEIGTLNELGIILVEYQPFILKISKLGNGFSIEKSDSQNQIHIVTFSTDAQNLVTVSSFQGVAFRVLR
jgi:hypothetical protein